MRRGGRVIWGAVDPVAPEGPSVVMDRVWAAARAVAGRRWRTFDVFDASMLSGTCGTGGVDVETEGHVARSLQLIASVLRGDPVPILDPPRAPPTEPTCAGPTGGRGRCWQLGLVAERDDVLG